MLGLHFLEEREGVWDFISWGLQWDLCGSAMFGDGRVCEWECF